MKNNYHIYKLIDPTTKKVRSVGVTTCYLQKRFYQHKYSAKKLRKTHCAKWINSLLKNNLQPIIELIETCNENNWEEREIYWISYFENLTNHLPGGKGVVLNRKKESLEKSSSSKKIPIVQLTKEGAFLKEWDSFKSASLFFNKSPNAIKMSILNNNLCSGFKWIEKKNYNPNSYENNLKTHYAIKKVYVYNELGEFEQTIFSVKETLNFFKLSGNRLRYCIKNKTKTKNKFFSYEKVTKFIPSKDYYTINQYDLENNLIKKFRSFSEIDTFFNSKIFFSSIYHRKERKNSEVVWRKYKWKIVKI